MKLNDLDLIEAENMDLPTYDFIRQICVVNIQQSSKSENNEQQHIIQTEKEMYDE